MIWIRLIIILICCIISYLTVPTRPEATRAAHIAERKRVDKSLTGAGSATAYYNAHKLYYDGVPDKYDTTGTKIKGVEPDPERALAYLKRACELSGSVDLWLQYAAIYHNGMYNLDPDLPTARALYEAIIAMFPNSGAAYDKLDEVTNEINTMNTYNWLNLKYTPKKNTHHEKIKSQRTGTGTGTGTRTGTGAWLGMFGAAATPVTQVFRAGDTVGININDIRHNDHHNTHNSQVVRTVANSLLKLKETTNISRSLPETIREIRDYLSSKPDCDRKNDALKSLDSIERNIIPISTIDMKESEAMNIVWNRIVDDRHKEHQEDIKDMLYHQLADMQEHGKSVCATGRLSRLLDTFSTFDNDVQIKPTYVIEKEMMDVAGKIREDMYSGYDPDTANKLREGTASCQSEFDRKLKDEIVATLRKDYVDTGIMTENAFTGSVNGWIDAI